MTALNVITMLLRGIHVAALLSLFGTLVFIAVMAEGLRDAVALRATLQRLARVSAACALLAGLAWLVVESAVIAGADSLVTTLHAVPIVGLRTQYGRWFVLRCVLVIILLAMPLSRRAGIATALVLAGLAVAVQPLLGHAGAIGGNVGQELVASEVLHLVAAGAWIGALLPLLIAVGRLPQEAAARMCRGFTAIGLSAVLLLAGTAFLQVATLMGGLPGLLGTPYGHVALVKLSLFIVLLTLAALNRLVLTERMAHGGSRSLMSLSIAAEIVLGVLVIVVAAFLSSLTPGTHEQPVWPLPWRPSLSALTEPVLRGELVAALGAFAVAVVLAIAGLAWRRIRWVALAAAVIVCALAIRHFDLLFAPAYPTSFFASPTEFAATSIAHGSRLFAEHCATCHGAGARGDGPAAKSLAVPPADLTAEHFWAHSDGDLYWFVSHGLTAPDGAVAMPAFGSALSSEAIWNLIDYLHAHNAGQNLRQTERWLHPLPVPQFDAICAGGRTVDLDDLRGRALHIVFASGDEHEPAETAPPVSGDVVTIVVARRRLPPNPSACVTREPEVWTAFAIILGVTPDTLAGAQVLADRDAWLRAAWRPGEPGEPGDARTLAAEIADINAHPVAIAGPGAHTHPH